MCIPCSKIFNAVPSNMIFDVGTLTLKFYLLYKTIDGDYDFWITGYILLLFTYGCRWRAMLSFWQLWLDFVATGGIVFHKYTLIFFTNTSCSLCNRYMYFYLVKCDIDFELRTDVWPFFCIIYITGVTVLAFSDYLVTFWPNIFHPLLPEGFNWRIHSSASGWLTLVPTWLYPLFPLLSRFK